MSFYCMCESVAGDDGQMFGAPNRYAALRESDDDDFPPVMLARPMVCIKTGARQVLHWDGKIPTNQGGGRPKYSHEHYPRVDVFECPNCKARMVRE